jgi:hypothetical protein
MWMAGVINGRRKRQRVSKKERVGGGEGRELEEVRREEVII